MFIIEKHNKIKLTHGDSAELDIRIYNKDGEEVEILPTDSIVMNIRKSADTEIKLQKIAYLNSINFIPADADYIQPGLYVYDITLYRDEEAQTIVPTSFIEILEAI